jgi:hypothetical protein
MIEPTLPAEPGYNRRSGWRVVRVLSEVSMWRVFLQGRVLVLPYIADQAFGMSPSSATEDRDAVINPLEIGSRELPGGLVARAHPTHGRTDNQEHQLPQAEIKKAANWGGLSCKCSAARRYRE